jgi:hypothetical protein
VGSSSAIRPLGPLNAGTGGPGSLGRQWMGIQGGRGSRDETTAMSYRYEECNEVCFLLKSGKTGSH